MTLNISYAGATYDDESALGLYCYNDGFERWQSVYSGIDTANDVIYATIFQPPCSEFAIMEQLPICGGEDPCQCGDVVIGYEAELEENLVCDGDALIIGEDNVELYCDGYSITGNGTGIGISATNKNGLEIYDCVISNFSTGIYFNNVTDSVIGGGEIGPNNQDRSGKGGIYFTLNSSYNN